MTLANLASISASAQLAAGRFHRHGGRIVGLVILLVIVLVVVLIIVQRRRDRRPLHDATPLRTSANETANETTAASTSPAPGGAVAATRVAPASMIRSTTIVEVPTMATGEPVPPGHYGLGGLLASEWTKLRTVRSTVWTLAITVVLGIGVSALATGETRSHWASMSVPSRLTFDPTATSLVGFFVAQFAIGVLGALAVSAEYGTGTIRATFAAAPNRLKVLLAKIIVFGSVALVASEVVAFASFFLGQALLSSPATHATLSSPGALRAVVGCGLYVTVLGLIALGLAVIIRFSAGAISAFVGILLVLPLIIATLPTSISQDLRRFLPDRIGATMITTVGGAPPGAFSPWVGFLILCIYAVALNVIGAVLLMRRDA